MAQVQHILLELIVPFVLSIMINNNNVQHEMKSGNVENKLISILVFGIEEALQYTPLRRKVWLCNLLN